jgi:hypothetical protein
VVGYDVLNPPFEVPIFNPRVSVDLHNERSIGWQRRLLFVHHITLAVAIAVRKPEERGNW